MPQVCVQELGALVRADAEVSGSAQVPPKHHLWCHAPSLSRAPLPISDGAMEKNNVTKIT